LASKPSAGARRPARDRLGDPIDAGGQPPDDAGGLFLRRKAVSRVGTLDTLIGVALLFAAVAIALRLAQNAILGRDR
jgi:hypothetical protein